MKITSLILGVFLSTAILAQALDPEAQFQTDVNKNVNVQQLQDWADLSLSQEQYPRYLVVMKRLAELHPGQPDVQMDLIKAHALMNEKTAAYDALINMQKAGLSYPIGDLPGFDNLKGTKVFDYIEDGMADNAQKYGEGKAVFEVSDHYSGLLFENVAYDMAGKRHLLASVRTGAIYQHTTEGGLKEFLKSASPETGPWGAIDLVVDAKADTLWVSSATMPQYNGTTNANFGRAMISQYKLSSGELVQNLMMGQAKQPQLFSSLHVSADQSLYFVDVFSSMIFEIKHGSDSVTPVLKLPNLKAIKAIATNQSGEIMYVADYDQGVLAVNLPKQQVRPLFPPDSGYYTGITDLFYDEGDLVVIQAGVSPQRLMRYLLKNDLLLHNMFPIEASHPKFDGLGKGVMVGDEVHYFANSQWPKMDPMGNLKSGEAWDALVLIQSPAKYKMDDHLAQQQRMEEIKKRRGIK